MAHGMLELLCWSPVHHGRQCRRGRSAQDPELAPVQLPWRGMSLCPTALEQEACMVGARADPTDLCCGLGFPGLVVLPNGGCPECGQ